MVRGEGLKDERRDWSDGRRPWVCEGFSRGKCRLAGWAGGPVVELTPKFRQLMHGQRAGSARVKVRCAVNSSRSESDCSEREVTVSYTSVVSCEFARMPPNRIDREYLAFELKHYEKETEDVFVSSHVETAALSSVICDSHTYNGSYFLTLNGKTVLVEGEIVLSSIGDKDVLNVFQGPKKGKFCNYRSKIFLILNMTEIPLLSDVQLRNRWHLSGAKLAVSCRKSAKCLAARNGQEEVFDHDRQSRWATVIQHVVILVD